MDHLRSIAKSNSAHQSQRRLAMFRHKALLATCALAALLAASHPSHAQCNPQALAQAVERANPGVDPAVKWLAFKELWSTFCGVPAGGYYQPAPQQPVGRTRELLSDAQVREAIIHESIARYQATGHPCACPENFARNGSRCGARSAYSRPGGAAPLCYPQDVSDGMVADWRRSHD
jgi:hypothetical protein